MKEQHLYDPEDLESLMMNKSFDELLIAERNFALRHVDDAAMYEAMRSTLLAITEHTAQHKSNVLPPSGKRKEALMEAYRIKHSVQKRPAFSLNGFSWFFSYWREKQLAPMLSIALVVLLVVGVWWIASDSLTPANRIAQIDEGSSVSKRNETVIERPEEPLLTEGAAATTESIETSPSTDNESDLEQALETDDDRSTDNFTPPVVAVDPATSNNTAQTLDHSSEAIDHRISSESLARTSSAEETRSNKQVPDQISSAGHTPAATSMSDFEVHPNTYTPAKLPAERLLNANVMKEVLGEMTAAE